MKRTGSILILSLLIVMLSFNFVSAAGLELIDSNPKQGYSKVEPKNVMIKLFFNEDMSAEATQAANKDKCTLKGSDGKTVPFTVLYDAKDKTKICLVLDADLVSSTEYTLSISGTVQSDSGNTLGEDQTLVFNTRNSGADANINMLMMGLMVIVMVGFTMRDAKKAAENIKKDQAAAVEINTNPYKYAKEKGITVEAAAKEIEAQKQKGSGSKKNKKPADKPKKVAPAKPEAPKKQVKKVRTQRRTKYKK